VTEKKIVECDGPDAESCLGTQPAYEGVPPEWSTFETDDTELHFCPPCTRRARGLLTGGRSVGPKLKVSHNYLGQDFEQAHINAGTHGITVDQVIDEPPRTFPNYDHDEDEAWRLGVFDHLNVYVFGSHKQEPLVVVQSEEWSTQLAVHEIEGDFEEPDPDFKIRSLEELREARDDE
jgi:hypothetical protein